MRHINFNVDPGVKYLMDGPMISALASANRIKQKNKHQNSLNNPIY